MPAMPVLYFPFTLRLYAHVLACLGDHNFTGLDLFYRIKDCWKGRDTPHDLLLRPLENGLPTKIGEWCFDTMFDLEGQSESMTRSFFGTLRGEDLMWFLQDLVEAARLSEFFGGSELLKAIAARIDQIGALYEAKEEEYWKQLQRGGRRKLTAMFTEFCGLRGPLSEMRNLYGGEIADRILHDRQLCSFIAETVMDIGFDGETVHGLREQWVARETWPARVKSILIARDRGKCAACGVDIIGELREDPHIDHMFPISRGGCNDLVNLQLLCSKCNRTKLDSAVGVTSSIPKYTRLSKMRKLRRKA